MCSKNITKPLVELGLACPYPAHLMWYLGLYLTRAEPLYLRRFQGFDGVSKVLPHSATHCATHLRGSRECGILETRRPAQLERGRVSKFIIKEIVPHGQEAVK